MLMIGESPKSVVSVLSSSNYTSSVILYFSFETSDAAIPKNTYEITGYPAVNTKLHKPVIYNKLNYFAF